MNAAYQTLIVKFSEPIKVLDASLTMPKRGELIPKRVDRRLREQQVYRHQQPYGSHHKRVQYGVPDGMVETKHTHCRDNRMLNKLAVSAPPTYNQEKHDSEDYFTADRRQTLCRHDGKQGLYRYG